MTHPIVILDPAVDDVHEREFILARPGQFLIGRAKDCDIQLPNKYAYSDVSRHHCLLKVELPGIRVRDLGSRNGTFVNGISIGRRQASQDPQPTDAGDSPECELHDGDALQMGHAVFRIRIAEEPITLIPPLFL